VQPNGLHSPLLSRMTQRQQEFVAIVEPLRPRLWRFVRVHCYGDDERGRDVVQETLYQALRVFDKNQEIANPASWLFAIARRVAAAYEASDKRTERIDSYEVDLRVSSQTAPDVAADIALLRAALDRLDPVQKEALMMADVADLPLSDIAEIQGASLSAIKSRVARARESVRRMLIEPTIHPEQVEL